MTHKKETTTTGVLSEPIENLIQDQSCGDIKGEDGKTLTVDVLIVGSGYGGAIAAMRLASKDKNQTVFVFERGKEYATGEFPESPQELPGHIQFLRKDKDLPVGYADALFDFRLDTPVSVLVGCGLGGTSLINANVAMEPEDDLFEHDNWPKTLSRDALRPSFDAVKKLLGVDRYEGAQKYAALERLADSMGAVCRPASIAVTRQNGPNAVGISQNACIGCGNCVTGCNVGAKNTLPMNVLPLAKSLGARLYTGATVLSVEPDGAPDGSKGWKVRFRRTATSKTVLHKEVFELHATAVILAAGTLGSTEILLRSQKLGGVKFSDHLGERFSSNGDALAFGYAQKNEVNAVASADLPPDQRDIGPTITGYVRADVGVGRPVTIEDGAVPSSLAFVFGEVLATASVFKRNIKARLPAWFKQQAAPGKDPLAVHPGALYHSQVLLVMGDDRAQDKLELEPREDGTPNDPDRFDRFRIRICKPAEGTPPESKKEPKKEPPVFGAVDRLLRHAERVGAFDGGDYLPNPFWKVLPETLSKSVPAPGKQLLSVHPLGGCPMGKDATAGAVNDSGQVFRADGTLYDGLYVMDGAIMPCAIGVNPFLTIAALAYRNAGKVVENLNKNPKRNPKWSVQGMNIQVEQNVRQTVDTTLLAWRAKAPSGEDETGHAVSETGWSAKPAAPDKRVKGTFVEFMTGPEVPQWLIDSFKIDAGKLNQKDKLVIKVEIDVNNVMSWLRAPNTPLQATATLYANRGSINPVREELLTELGVDNEGKVALLAWDRPSGWLQQANRAMYAMCAFLDRRGLGDAAGGTAWWNPGEAIKALIGFLRVAWNHANWRQLSYHFTFKTENGSVELRGTKELAYATGKKDPWSALTELPFTLRGASGSIDGELTVDLIKLTEHAPFQADASPDSPTTIAAMVGAGMMFLRVVFQTHFWSFGAPNYPTERPDRPGLVNRNPEPVRLKGEPEIGWKEIPLPVQASEKSPDTINLRLVHYEPKSPRTRGSILLIHGLASGSRVFATDTIKENFATYFYRLGYDVWLFDYRVSIALPPSVPQLAPSELLSDMDQIAKYDMHEAVKYVYDTTNKGVKDETQKKPIQVFAHCVGAASLAMAILKGYCHDPNPNDPRFDPNDPKFERAFKKGEGRSMISTLALHAVPPWPVPSPVNHLKANLAAFVRDALSWKTLDAVLPDKDSVTTRDVMMDRIAGSIPFPASLKKDVDRHRRETDGARMGKNICDRMTLFYGWEWNHGGLNEETHKRLAELVGVANFETFRHIYFLLTRKRLTTRMGEDTYVKENNFRDYWTFPTLFAHGSDNQLYDPRSAVASCLRLRTLREQAGYPNRPTYDVHSFEASPCGHFDFLFGKDASTKVYPSLSAFFQKKRNEQLPTEQVQLEQEEEEAWQKITEKDDEVENIRVPSRRGRSLQAPSRRDPYWGEISKIPTRGPIIGWARRDEQKNDGTVVLRFWIEPYRFSATTPPEIPEDHPSGIKIVKLHPLPTVDPDPDDRIVKHPFPTHENDYPGTYWVYDVVLPPGFPQDLLIKVEYPADAQPIKVTLEPVREAPPADELHDPEKGVWIPLTRLPWFSRLKEKEDSKRVSAAFLVGSCRYPGSPFDERLADRVFQAMHHHVNNVRDKNGTIVRHGIDHVLLVGDQIYADATADIFDTRELRERFAGQYRDVFRARYLRRLLASVPVYMALDDHEFDDNWPGDADDLNPDDPLVKTSRENFKYGLAAAMAYQWSMSPQNGWPLPDPSNWPKNHDSGLWHHFTSGGLPFFVMDTRTERTLRQARISRDQANLVGERQLKALTDWLDKQKKENPNKPKFIVSGSVLAPVSKSFTEKNWLYRSNDGWAGYPATWRKLVKHIVDEQIQKVVFVAGDYHFSAWARLTLSSEEVKKKDPKKKDIDAYQIVSSGLFVPLSFANAKAGEFEWSKPSTLPFSDPAIAEIKVEPHLLCAQSSHFLRVDAKCASGSDWTIGISAYDCNGVKLMPEGSPDVLWTL